MTVRCTADAGAFFGTTFPHLLLQCYRDLAPSIIAPVTTSVSSTPQEDSSPAKDAPMDVSPDALAQPTAKASALTPARLGRKTPHTGIYVPRIYGFRVSEFATSGPRMQWMRLRPHALAELEPR